MPVYTVSQVSQMLGVSRSTVVNYTKDDRLQRHLSAGAVSVDRSARQLTSDDVRTLHYVVTASRSRETIDSISARLDAGALEEDDWQPETPETQLETSSTAIVLVKTIAGQLQQLEEAHAREREQAQKIAELERELATVKTQLAERQRSFWSRLFGR